MYRCDMCVMYAYVQVLMCVWYTCVQVHMHM